MVARSSDPFDSNAVIKKGWTQLGVLPFLENKVRKNGPMPEQKLRIQPKPAGFQKHIAQGEPSMENPLITENFQNSSSQQIDQEIPTKKAL